MPDQSTPTVADQTRLRAVEAALATLRRGMPVRIEHAQGTLAVLCMEVADEDSLALLHRLGPPCLMLASGRAEALAPGSHGALALDAAGLTLAALRSLADPTLDAPTLLPDAMPLPPDAEAAFALAVLARLLPALLAVPVRGPGLAAADILAHASRASATLVRVSEAAVPLEDVADARLVAFRALGTGVEQYAILIGRPEDQAAPLARIHSECFTGDLLGSLRCDCGSQLRTAIQRMAQEGAGVLLYLAQEGRGIGLPNKLRAYALQDRGLDTLDANRALGFAADEREFRTAAAMLHQLAIHRVRLLTNNPDKIAALAAQGIEIAGRASLLVAANGVNDGYLRTKTTRFGHLG